MWLADHSWGVKNAERRRTDKSLKYRATTLWAYFMILAGSFITIGGTYGSIVGIINDYAGTSVSRRLL